MEKLANMNVLGYNDKGQPYIRDTYVLGEMMYKEKEWDAISGPFRFCPFCGDFLQ